MFALHRQRDDGGRSPVLRQQQALQQGPRPRRRNNCHFYTSVIGKEALPEKVRANCWTRPRACPLGAVQVFGDLDSDDDDEGRAILAQPLADGKTLYMYDVDHDQEEGGEVETPLSGAAVKREEDL